MIETNSELKEVLTKAKTVAMIGCSANEHRTSHYAAHFLQERGFRLIPINPNEDEILGEKCYDGLNDIPKEVEVDVVNVFRNSRYSADAVSDVAQWKKETGQNPVVWTQLDVSSPEAEKIAESNQLPYVKNKCIMVEWDRFFKE